MKFLVHTYGCQMNVRDSEAVEALMLAAGYEKAADESKALSGTPAEAAAARTRWTEAARDSYRRAEKLAREKGARAQ